MNFSSVQPMIIAALRGSSLLAALGEPFTYDPDADEKSTEEAMATVRRTTGVAIEIGEPWLAQVDNLGGGGTTGQLFAEIFISESPTVAHTPKGKALLDAIVPVLRGAGFELRDTGETYLVKERGYILRVLIVSIPGIWGAA